MTGSTHTKKEVNDMALYTQNIGTDMPHGQAGSYARQPDMIVNTRPAGEGVIPFGAALTYDSNKRAVVFGTQSDNKFIGVAAREIKPALDYLNQSIGQYSYGDPVPVFMRGAVNVKCQRSTPSLGGAVYVRTAVNESYPGCVVGGFEAESDSGKTVMLGNCQWGGGADADGIAELKILTMANA